MGTESFLTLLPFIVTPPLTPAPWQPPSAVCPYSVTFLVGELGVHPPDVRACESSQGPARGVCPCSPRVGLRRVRVSQFLYSVTIEGQ